MEKAKRTASIALFLAILSALLLLCGRVLARKSLSGAWDMTNKIAGFYNEPEEEFDVMFFGGSHAYASFSPLELWHETGVKSYVFATQQQPMWATYHYILEALKTQSPSVIVLDVQTMVLTEDYSDAAVVHSYLDDLPLSTNKLALIGVSGEGEALAEYLFPLIKYHDRWDELTAADFTFDRNTVRDPLKGYVLLSETGFVPTRYDAPAYDVLLHQKSLDYLLKIADLCRERGIDLWLVKTPSNPETEQQAVFRTLEKALAQEGLALNDFNASFDEIGLSLETDYYDQHHLNAAGARKFTDWFAARMTERFQDLDTDPENTLWQADYEAYTARIPDGLSPVYAAIGKTD